MTRETLQRIRNGERVPVTVKPESIGPGELPRNLRGDLVAVSVTDSGFVQLEYPGKNYGPTLHHEALRTVGQ